MPRTRASPFSDHYRNVGLELLRTSAVYERVDVSDLTPALRAVVSLAGRCRRFMRAAYALADRGLGLEGQVLIRVLIEYAITIRWLLLDPDLHFARWAADDIRRRFVMDRAMQDMDEPPLYEEEARREWTERRAEFVEQCGDEPSAPPRLEQQAIQTGATHTYGLGYRYESQAGAHPTPFGAEAMLERDHRRRVYVVGEPTFEVFLDVFAAGVVTLHTVLVVVGNVVPAVALEEDLNRINEEIASAQREREERRGGAEDSASAAG